MVVLVLVLVLVLEVMPAVVKQLMVQVRNRGTAHLDSREDSQGNMQTRFLMVEVSTDTVINTLFLQIENMLKNTVVVVDNRGKLWSEGAALE